MDEFSTDTTPAGKFSGKRPVGLTLLCILTFIGSGLSAMSSFFVAIAYNIIPMAVKESPFGDTAALLELIKSAGPSFFIIMGVLYLGSLSGAIFMFQLRKTGFHVYTLAQLIMLIIPSLMIEGYILPFANLLLTGSFVLAYGINLRIMR
ncbi:MAG: hypothetical protein HGA37_00040 [Lentimicrobium sp.]|nr:hypothetical protein [Lentimicrobium sp.]